MTDPWCVIFATNTDAQKQDADVKEFTKIAKKMTIDVTKLINYQMNQSMQTVEKNTWQGVITVKLNKKKEQLKYFQQIAEWEDE